jgi:uncharacterized spore protein YtfJ
MEAQTLLKEIVEDMRQVAKTETVIGEPIEIAGNTIIPVSRISMGFGGGTGHGEGGDEAKHNTGEGEGGGGGGAIRVDPAAFIVIREGKVEVQAVPAKRGALDELFDRMPEMLDKVMGARQNKESTAKA